MSLTQDEKEFYEGIVDEQFTKIRTFEIDRSHFKFNLLKNNIYNKVLNGPNYTDLHVDFMPKYYNDTDSIFGYTKLLYSALTEELPMYQKIFEKNNTHKYKLNIDNFTDFDNFDNWNKVCIIESL